MSAGRKFGATLGLTGLAVGLAGGGVALEIHNSDHIPSAWLTPAPLGKEIVPNGEMLICPAASTACTAQNPLGYYATGRHADIASIHAIPPYTQFAIKDKEDRTFDTNDGVSGAGTEDAIIRDIAGTLTHQDLSYLKAFGASTITRQVINMTRFNPESGSGIIADFEHQKMEGRMALELTKEESKADIFLTYADDVPLGRNSYGLAAAAQAYFGESSVGQLTEEQSIMLAAMIDNPANMETAVTDYNDPTQHDTILANLKTLRNAYHHVDRDMVNNGHLTPGKDGTGQYYDNLFDSRFVFDSHGDVVDYKASKIPFKPYQPTNTLHMPNAEAMGAQGFVQYVLQQAAADLGKGGPGDLPAGIKIITTLDVTDQQAAYAAFHDRKLKVVRTIMDSPTLNYGFVSLRQSGRVAAMLGSKDYDQVPENLALGTLDGGSGRSDGSENKAFALADGLDNGMNLTDMVHIPKTITYHDPRPHMKPWTVNSGQGCDYLPPPRNHAPCVETVGQAFAASSNMLPILIAQRIGIQPILHSMQELGLPVNQNSSPAALLGIMPTSPYQVAVGYAAFTNQGRKVGGYVINKIVSATGETLFQQPQPTFPEQVFSPQAATQTLQALKDVLKPGGTLQNIFSLPNGPRSAGGKTGTNGSTGPAKAPTDLGTTIVACDTERGDRIASTWVGDPSGLVPITSITASNQIAPIDNDYLSRSLNTGVACDVAAPSN